MKDHETRHLEELQFCLDAETSKPRRDAHAARMALLSDGALADMLMAIRKEIRIRKDR
jgi:hypothetical protein